MKTPNIIDDIYAEENGCETREIESVVNDNSKINYAIVGLNGVTKILAYKENGQMSWVPWAAIYKGDFLCQRVDLAGTRVIYKEAPHA
jgi:hypothetical protein